MAYTVTMNEENRRSGRTTRLVDEAKRLDEAGKAVYIVAASSQERNRIMMELGNTHPGIKVEHKYALRFLDWKTMRLEHAHPNCVVLVDHHAIESEYAGMLEMLHRFDLMS